MEVSSYLSIGLDTTQLCSSSVVATGSIISPASNNANSFRFTSADGLTSHMLINDVDNLPIIFMIAPTTFSAAYTGFAGIIQGVASTKYLLEFYGLTIKFQAWHNQNVLELFKY